MLCYGITVIGGTVALTCGGAVTGGPIGKKYLASPAVTQQFDIWIGKGEIPQLYRGG